MLRPLALDLSAALAPVGVAALAFVGGTRLRRLPAAGFRLAVALAVCVVAVLGLAYLTSFKERTGAFFSPVGGETVPACWSAAFLLGVVWASPGRSTSS